YFTKLSVFPLARRCELAAFVWYTDTVPLTGLSMPMTPALQEVCCARLPAAGLAVLAELRCRADIEVVPEGASLWVRWPAGDDEVLRRVLPVPGVGLYVRRGNAWYRWGERLPCDAPPADAGRRLDACLV